MNEAEYPAQRAAASWCGPNFLDAWGRPCNGSVVPPPPPVDPTARRHDGFYLRAAVGPVFTFAGRNVVSHHDVLGATLELQFGGTPWTGLVVGGGFSTGSTGRQDLATYSAFVNYYPDPTAGLHVQAQGGASIVGSGDAGPFGAIGGGIDGWVGSQTSLGFFARAGYASGTYSAYVGNFTYADVHMSTGFVTAQFTFTWH